MLDGTRCRVYSVRMLYFIGAFDGDTLCAIKIGYVSNINNLCRRASALQIGNHLAIRVIGMQNGNFSDEREQHRVWAKHRIRGEWFAPADELVALATSCPVSRADLVERPSKPSVPGMRSRPRVEPVSTETRKRKRRRSPVDKPPHWTSKWLAYWRHSA